MRDPFVAGGDQHVDEAVDIDRVGLERVLDRARHRAEGCLVEHVVGISHGAPASVDISDVAFEHAKALQGRRADRRFEIGEIVLMAGREIVESDHDLAETQQRLHEIGADEAGGTGYKPAFRALLQRRLDVVIGLGGQRVPLRFACRSCQDLVVVSYLTACWSRAKIERAGFLSAWGGWRAVYSPFMSRPTLLLTNSRE